jgi:hypothetical protein
MRCFAMWASSVCLLASCTAPKAQPCDSHGADRAVQLEPTSAGAEARVDTRAQASAVMPEVPLFHAGAFGLGVRYVPHDTGIELEFWQSAPRAYTRTAFPTTDTIEVGYEHRTETYSTDYAVIHVAAESSVAFFVVGHPVREHAGERVAYQSTTVIERWEVVPSRGMPYLEAHVDHRPLGTPQTELALHLRCGDGVLSPLRSIPRPHIDRRPIGTFDFDVAALAADPDGRYLIVANMDLAVLQLDLTTLPVALQLLVAPGAVSGIDGWWSISRLRGSDGVKRFELFAPPTRTFLEGAVLVLRDPENDGVLDIGTATDNVLHVELTYDEREQTDYVSYAIELFD